MTWRPSSQRGWRAQALAEVRAICVPSWPRSYSVRVDDQILFALSRAEAVVRSGRHDCEISFERVELASVNVRDPAREDVASDGYPQLVRDLARPTYDSVPVVCGVQGGRCAIWDGHHRLRSYELAGRRDMAAIVVRIGPGDGSVRLRPARSEG